MNNTVRLDLALLGYLFTAAMKEGGVTDCICVFRSIFNEVQCGSIIEDNLGFLNETYIAWHP
jgi:hypothetical protein